jgi:hypothetical protein
MAKEEPNRQTDPKNAQGEGQAIVAQNAKEQRKNSEAVYEFAEDPKVFDALHAGMVASFDPKGPFEEALVDRLASLWWRLKRVGRAEREGFTFACERMAGGNNGMTCKFMCSLPVHVAFTTWGNNPEEGHVDRLLRYEGQLERSFFRLLHELERIQARRQGQTVTLPQVADVNLHHTTGGDGFIPQFP